MSGGSRAHHDPVSPPRRYHAPQRQQRVAETRERILSAASALVHEFASWDWRQLTFRAVAERAGVGERTVYRHFPTERQLHEAVMRQLEVEAGVAYEDVTLDNLGAVTSRVLDSWRSFAAAPKAPLNDDPALVAADERRRRSLMRAVSSGTQEWSERERAALAALLDVLWHVPSYERLVSSWGMSGDDAEGALVWAISRLVSSIESDDPPALP